MPGLAAGPVFAEDDVAPTPEQVTERTAGLEALWSALRTEVAGMRIRQEQALVSSGEFGGARATWGRVGLAVEGGVPIGPLHVGVSPSVAYERLRFDGSDDWRVSRAGRDSHFDDFLEASLRLGSLVELGHGMAIEALAGATLRQETGAAFDESLQVGGSFAGTYERGDWLRLRLGLGIGADLADNQMRLSPVYRVRMRPRPDWTLDVSGLRGRIAWEPGPRLELELSGGLESTQYRLDRRSRPPTSLGSGTLQRRQSSVGLAAAWRVRDWLRLRPSLGLVLEEEIAVLDGDGEEIDARHERDPSVIAALRIELRP